MAPSSIDTDVAHDLATVERHTRNWVEKAIIGLNLCPFAKAVQRKNQVRYVVSNADTGADLALELSRELRLLQDADPEQVDTTLLIHPRVLTDFFDYNVFLSVADRMVRKAGLDGELQIASFHPQYAFGDADPDAIENYTNRSPYPMLHLLREASIARAVAAFSDAGDIYERNKATLRELGMKGWQELDVGRDTILPSAA
ncbi:MAG: DUF1415 domain-containing protein [Herminiimonas sp.]|nr:DUF1415 domain-containing protein [Herminiimonas sp.]